MFTCGEHPDTVKTPAMLPLADRALVHELCLYSQHKAQALRGLRDPRANVPPSPTLCLLLHLLEGVGES